MLEWRGVGSSLARSYLHFLFTQQNVAAMVALSSLICVCIDVLFERKVDIDRQYLTGTM